jgi:hypothetical protein
MNESVNFRALLTEARILRQEARALSAQASAALRQGNFDSYYTLNQRSVQLRAEATTLVNQVASRRYQG